MDIAPQERVGKVFSQGAVSESSDLSRSNPRGFRIATMGRGAQATSRKLALAQHEYVPRRERTNISLLVSTFSPLEIAAKSNLENAESSLALSEASQEYQPAVLPTELARFNHDESESSFLSV